MKEILREMEHNGVDSHAIKSAASTVMRDVEKLGKATQAAAKEVGQELFEKGQAKFSEKSQEISKYVQKYPLRVVLGAVGLGFVLGMIRKAVK